MKPTFREQSNVGKARYLVSFHDGKKTHADGSPFFDIRIFKNKRKKQKFISSLVASGYTDGSPKKKVKTKEDKEIDKIIKKHGGLENLNDTLLSMGCRPL